MQDKEAKRILTQNTHDVYLRGEHGEEWQAIGHVLRRWERSERKLHHMRIQLKELLEKWKDDVRHGRGTTAGIADRINQMREDLRKR